MFGLVALFLDELLGRFRGHHMDLGRLEQHVLVQERGHRGADDRPEDIDQRVFPETGGEGGADDRDQRS